MKFLFSVLFFISCSIAYASTNEKKLANLELNKSNFSVLDKYGSPNEIEIEISDYNLLQNHPNFGKIYTTPKSYETLKYIYNRSSYQITVLLDQNMINSITISGSASPFKTKRNIELGSKYSEVNKVYGNPNYIARVGNEVTLSYDEKIKFKFIKSQTLPLQEWVVSQISIHSN